MTVGETHTPSITFRDVDNALYDPTTVTGTVRSPSGTITNPATSQVSTGLYQMTFTLTQKGIWRFEFTGTGPSGAIVRETSYVCVSEDVAA